MSASFRRILAAIGVSVLSCQVPVLGGAYVIPDAEMANHFTEKSDGNSSITSVIDVAGPGVGFDLDLADPSLYGDGKTLTKDDWAIHSDAGLASDGGWYPNDPNLPHASAHNNVSIAAWDKIQMKVTVLSGPAGGDLDIHLFMSTGMTGASGYPSSDLTNDTFWAGDWVNVKVGEWAILTLDFNDCEAWNITDNKFPHTPAGGGGNGDRYAINERDRREVTAMGFEFADFDLDLGGGQVQILIDPVPEPASLGLISLGAVLISLRRKGPRAAW